MDHNYTGDDIIEIVPDTVPEEDHDIKISGKENITDGSKQEEAEEIRKAADTADSGNSAGFVNTEETEIGAKSENIEETTINADPGDTEITGISVESGDSEVTEISAGSADAEIIEISADPGDIETTGIGVDTDDVEMIDFDVDPENTEQITTGLVSEEAENPVNINSLEDIERTESIENTETIENAEATENEVSSITDDTAYSEKKYSADEDFSEEFYEIEHEQQDYEIMEQIGDSIIKQVEGLTAIEKGGPDSLEEDGTDDEMNSENDDGNGSDPSENEDEDRDINPVFAFFRKIPKWGYAVIGSALVLTFFLLWITMSAAGQSILVKLGSKWIAGKFTYQPVEEVSEIEYLPENDLENRDDPIDVTGVPEVPDNYEVVTPDITEEPTPIPEEKNVYNILLIGEENIDSGSSRGRSDLIMVASINREQRKVKLISILRDILVAIPNHSDNKINASYTICGVSLLYDTLKVNLGIEFDNYCLVNFDSFENIVDAIGGIDVELTAEEAAYLNKTNYISKPEFRTVVTGMNHFNGNQALGYCRIRKVPTADMLYSDIGRTSRQRRLMRQIFERFNKMNNVEIMGFVNNCTPFLTTDLTSEQLEQFILMLTEMNPVGYEEMRLPVEGSYHDAKLRGMLVTQIDLTANSEALHSFIYGN